MSDDEDDGPLELPADTLLALAEFRQEKAAQDKRFDELKAQAEDQFDSNEPISMDLFSEDWNASQFWYTDATALILAKQLLDGATASSAIAVVSAPSAFVALKNLLRSVNPADRPQVLLLEYDTRFEVFRSEFQPYDFADPLKLPAALKGRFDRLIVDPPFLSEDCQTKSALTARYLAKSWTRDDLRLISCTGERMSLTIHRLYESIGMKTTTFEPRHQKGLSNEFRCFANFKCDDWDLQS